MPSTGPARRRSDRIRYIVFFRHMSVAQLKELLRLYNYTVLLSIRRHHRLAETEDPVPSSLRSNYQNTPKRGRR